MIDTPTVVVVSLSILCLLILGRWVLIASRAILSSLRHPAQPGAHNPLRADELAEIVRDVLVDHIDETGLDDCPDLDIGFAEQDWPEGRVRETRDLISNAVEALRIELGLRRRARQNDRISISKTAKPGKPEIGFRYPETDQLFVDPAFSPKTSKTASPRASWARWAGAAVRAFVRARVASLQRGLDPARDSEELKTLWQDESFRLAVMAAVPASSAGWRLYPLAPLAAIAVGLILPVLLIASAVPKSGRRRAAPAGALIGLAGVALGDLDRAIALAVIGGVLVIRRRGFDGQPVSLSAVLGPVMTGGGLASIPSVGLPAAIAWTLGYARRTSRPIEVAGLVIAIALLVQPGYLPSPLELTALLASEVRQIVGSSARPLVDAIPVALDGASPGLLLVTAVVTVVALRARLGVLATATGLLDAGQVMTTTVLGIGVARALRAVVALALFGSPPEEAASVALVATALVVARIAAGVLWDLLGRLGPPPSPSAPSGAPATP